MPEERVNITLGTAGHVDHGKTALVKMLTGCDTDRLKAEKQRGLTIELGFAPCRMADERIVGIVDVPGHVDFIRNMVAGAHGIDVVLFVIAADDSIMPQTREHLDILTLMGCRHGLVALTKIDLVDKELREIALSDVREFLGGTFLESAPICPLSNITGEGYDGFFKALNQVVEGCRPHEITGLFRMWAERVFSLRGIGTVVSGIPTSGEVRIGDRLQVVPGEATGRVRGVQVYGRDAEVGRAGECIAVNLSDVSADTLDRGKVLARSGACEAVSLVEADLRLLGHAPAPLKDYAEVHLHVGTAEAIAHVAILDAHHVVPGETRPVQLRLAEPLGMAAGDRFVIRAGLAGLAGGGVATVGGGRILGTSNIRLRRNRPWTLQMLAARRDAIDSPSAWCEALLKEAGEALSPAELARRAQMQPRRVDDLLAALRDEGTVLDAGAAVVHRDVVRDAAARMSERLDVFHEANPMRLGMEATDLAREAGGGRGGAGLALEGLIADGKVERHGSVVALAGRGARVSAEDARLREQVESALREAGLTPPPPEAIAESLGADADRVAAIMRLLGDEGTLVRLDEGLVMHRDAVEKAKRVVLDLFAKSGGFSTVEFRDALGTSRKFAVPLLDYFDTIRLTVRSGSRRTPGAEAKRLL
ncbi:MAG TPA: selenocysteine-specific translation elongation factor [Phycisphaerae bacterium]|nr:selenocysteine-specific translation elongation factor [Phycisphaerae bacterium]